MCAICGIIDGNLSRVDIGERVHPMMRSMVHRGPDDSGSIVEDGMGLGHQRLSIIGIEGGRQPIGSEDGSVQVVYNGEIYNYRELKDDLAARGHRFNTRTDTEVIVHAYEEYGTGCVDRLRGMFAFAVWDAAKKRFFLARDRVGIKPLYYVKRGSTFAFASEIKAFFASGIMEPSINVKAMDSYLTLNYVLGPETAFEGVYKLMPGHYLVYENGDIKTRQYWDFNDIEETDLSFSDCVDRLDELLEDTTRRHLMSEVPLGAFLSGGVDSSLTTAIMTKLTSSPARTFTVGYENNPDDSELAYARTVAEHIGTEHHEFILDPRGFNDAIPRVLWHLDEPVAEYATIPLMLLSEMAKKHVTVMLSGEGADELFGGYPIYRYMALIEKYRSIPGFLRDTILLSIFRLLFGRRKNGKYVDWLTQPLDRRYLGNGSYLTESIKDSLYTKEMRALVRSDESIYDKIGGYYENVNGRDPVRKMLYFDTKTWLPEDLLLKADKTTMAASLELRVPFLDHELLEFATSLPSSMKVRKSITKYILKEVARRYIPGEIIDRKKQGFPVPMKNWLKGDLNTLARDVLLDERTRQRGYFNPAYVERMLDQHSRSEEDLKVNIWNLLLIEFWHRLFIDRDSEMSYLRRTDNGPGAAPAAATRG